MKIKRSLENDGNIQPDVYNLLNNLPKEVLHYHLTNICIH